MSIVRPLGRFAEKGGCTTNTLQGYLAEALGQLGQDEPASGMALEPLVAFALADKKRPPHSALAHAVPHFPRDPAVGRCLQEYLAHKKTPTPQGPPRDPRHRPTVGS